jgi:hypothetical protein
MWQDLTEIDEIFNRHDYDTTNIITNMFHQFKLKIAFKQYGVQKQQGFSVEDIIFILLFLPLMGAKSICHFYRKHFEKVATMQKDTLYRFLNNPDIDWRRILLSVAKRFDSLTGSRKDKELNEKSAVIIDDSALVKTGLCIEKLSYIFDHVLKKTLPGFKNLVLAHYDGISYKVLDTSLHSEKKLKRKHQRKQFKSSLDKISPAFARRKECDKDKITVAIEMIKRAAKNGFRFRYVVMDSWYSSRKLLQAVRNLHQNTVHAICAVKKDKRKYNYFGQSLNANHILAELKQEFGKGKRNRKNRVRYYETIVDYEGVGPVRLYFAKGSHQRHWKLFLSTDTRLNFNQFVEIYSIRWGIEVIFKECKSYLRIGKCQARSFTSQIASLTICYILYNILVYQKRAGDYTTIGCLFEHLAGELQEKSIAEKLWDMFKELLQLMLENISIEYGPIKSYQDLTKTRIFKCIEEKFSNSLIGSFLQNTG